MNATRNGWTSLLIGEVASPLAIIALFATFLIAAALKLVLHPGPVDRNASDEISESIVVGSVKRYKVTGDILRERVGRYMPESEPSPRWHVRKQFLDFPGTAQPTGVWTAYQSRFGLGPVLYRSACMVESWAGRECTLRDLRLLNIALLAACLAAVCTALTCRYGLALSVPFAGMVLGSLWVSRYAENLYWSPWVYLMPALAWVPSLVRRHIVIAHIWRGLWLYSILILAFFLIGFEFTTTAVGLSAALFVLAVARLHVGAGAVLKVTAAFVAATCGALVVALLGLHDLRYMSERFAINTKGIVSGLEGIVEPEGLALYVDAFRSVYALVPSTLLIAGCIAAVGTAAVLAAVRVRTIKPTALGLATVLAIALPAGWVIVMKRHAFLHDWVTPMTIELVSAPFALGMLCWLGMSAVVSIARSLLPRGSRGSDPGVAETRGA